MLEVTQDKLKELMVYDRVTGIFRSVKDNEVLGAENSSGHLKTQIGTKQYVLHRLAWLYEHGEWPVGIIDHIDHNRKHNAIENLRDVSIKENSKNQRIGKNNKSGVTGVFWNKAKNKWQACVKVDGKNKHLGYFSDMEEATRARQVANELYGFHENHGKR